MKELAFLLTFAFGGVCVAEFTDCYSLCQNAVYIDSDKQMLAHWPELDDDEKISIYSLAVKLGATSCVKSLLDNRIKALAWNQNGELIYFSTTSSKIRRIIEANTNDLSDKELYRHFIHRILAGLDAKNSIKTLLINGEFDLLPAGSEFIQQPTNAFIHTDNVEITLKELSDKLIRFDYQKNWKLMDGITGSGTFTKIGRFWKIRWKGAVEG